MSDGIVLSPMLCVCMYHQANSRVSLRRLVSTPRTFSTARESSSTSTTSGVYMCVSVICVWMYQEMSHSYTVTSMLNIIHVYIHRVPPRTTSSARENSNTCTIIGVYGFERDSRSHTHQYSSDTLVPFTLDGCVDEWFEMFPDRQPLEL